MKLKVVIGKDETKKKEFLSGLNGYETYYNPENDKHPAIQTEFIEQLIQETNRHDKQVAIATNSPYVLTVLNNLLFAGVMKNNMSKDKFLEIMGNEHKYISPNQFDVINLDTGKSIINREDENYPEIQTEEIDDISDEVNKQYSQLYYLYIEKEEAC